MNDAELVGLCDEWDAKRPFAEEQVNEIVAGVRRLVCEKQEADMALATKIRMGTALEADNARLREALTNLLNEVDHKRYNIRKDTEFFLADAAARNAIQKAGG